MKTISILLLPWILAGSAQASYYEDWILDVEILEVYDEQKTVEILKKRRDIQFEKMRLAMKVRTTKCKFVEGHDQKLCRENQVVTIVLSFEAEPETPFQVGDALRIRYFYSNGRVPPGEEANSHVWTLVAENDEEE